MSTDSLELYRPADNAPTSADYLVTVNGRPVHVYDSEAAAYCIFSFTGTVELRIVVRENHKDIILRPFHNAPQTRWDGNVVSFTLDRPAKLCFDPPWKERRPLFLFAGAPETDVPDPSDPNVKFFEGGKVHEAGVITLASGQTLYIAGGAIVRGCIEAVDAQQVRVAGRGILDGAGAPRGRGRRLMYFGKCVNVDISGITTVATPSWTIMLHRCKGCRVHDVREIGWVVGSDGVDIVASHDVTVEDCFLRNNDDCIAVKAFPGYRQVIAENEPAPVPLTVQNVTVRDCVFFNAHAGNVMEIGFELRSDLVKDIVFRNCDVIAAHGEGGVFTIHNGDHAMVENVLYEDIRVEHYYDRFVDFRVLRSRYSRDEERGRIRNVTLRNIRAAGNTYNCLSLLGGFDECHLVEDITFENVTVGERHAAGPDNLHLFANAHVRNVQYR